MASPWPTSSAVTRRSPAAGGQAQPMTMVRARGANTIAYRGRHSTPRTSSEQATPAQWGHAAAWDEPTSSAHWETRSTRARAGTLGTKVSSAARPGAQSASTNHARPSGTTNKETRGIATRLVISPTEDSCPNHARASGAVASHVSADAEKATRRYLAGRAQRGVTQRPGSSRAASAGARRGRPSTMAKAAAKESWKEGPRATAGSTTSRVSAASASARAGRTRRARVAPRKTRSSTTRARSVAWLGVMAAT